VRPFDNIIIGSFETFSSAQFSPAGSLKPGTRYRVIVDGVRGADGSKLGGVDDPTARFRDGKVVWSSTTGGG